MVDRDKIKKRTGGKKKSSKRSKKKKKKRKKKKKKKPKKGKSKKTKKKKKEVDYNDSTATDTKADKMAQMKKAKGLSSGGDKAKGDGKVPREEAGKLIEAIGNVVLHAEGVMRSHEDPSTKREQAESAMSGVIVDNFTRFISRFNVQAICEKYNVDWEKDVVEPVLSGDDFDDKVEKHKRKGGLDSNIGNGKDFEKRDVYELLMALGAMLMFSKMMNRRVEDPEDKFERMGEKVIKDVNSKLIDFLGIYDVMEVAEIAGIDWEMDVLGKLDQADL